MDDIFASAEAAFAEPAPKPQPQPQPKADGEAPPPPKAKRRGSPDAEAEAARIAELEAAADAIQDGVYFDLPMEVYRRVKRLGSSSHADILVSPGTFWAGSWMNPDRKEKEETDAQELGSAYHCARLEPDVFHERYCRSIDKGDFPDDRTVWNGTEIAAALADLGQPKTKGGESVLEKAERLEAAGFSGFIWPLEEARFHAKLGGKIPISAEAWADILVDMERIRKVPDIAALLSGGFAEVSIFWTDQYGLKCKARTDYLRAIGWADFKTFANPRGKVLRQALAEAFRYNRNYLQAKLYLDATEAIRVGGLQIVGEASDAQRELIARIQMKPDPLECHYIYQEKGGIPNLMAMRVPFWSVPHSTQMNHIGATEEQIAAVERTARQKTGIHIRAIQDLDQAKRQFILYSQVYQDGEPWAPIEPVSEFEDLDFNSYWLEGRND